MHTTSCLTHRVRGTYTPRMIREGNTVRLLSIIVLSISAPAGAELSESEFFFETSLTLSGEVFERDSDSGSTLGLYSAGGGFFGMAEMNARSSEPGAYQIDIELDLDPAPAQFPLDYRVTALGCIDFNIDCPHRVTMAATRRWVSSQSTGACHPLSGFRNDASLLRGSELSGFDLLASASFAPTTENPPGRTVIEETLNYLTEPDDYRIAFGGCGDLFVDFSEPSLAADLTLHISIAPLTPEQLAPLLEPEVPNTADPDSVSVTWQAFKGYEYQIECYSPSAGWNPVGAPYVGDNSRMSGTFSSLNRLSRFYRVRITAIGAKE